MRKLQKHVIAWSALISALCATACPLPIFAQQDAGSLRGKVVDEASAPMIGASVMVKGSTKGVLTDAEGMFTLTGLTEGDVLEISYLGYDPQEVVYHGQTFLDVTLHEQSLQAEAVVVTALGIKRSEKALSYNVQKVSGEEITAVKDANFMNSLVGKVAGVTINSGANGAGGASRVVMRGAKSLTGSNIALYVIDGIPMSNYMSNTASAGVFADQPGTDAVADINPEDIESISMLTGPSAAALYGNAAASGVVLITTKKGSEDKTTVTVSNSTTFSSVYMLPEMQSKYGNASGQTVSWGNAAGSDYAPEKFFNNGVNTINTVSLSTGNAKNQTYISATTTNTTGTLPNSRYNRYNFAARNTTRFAREKLTLDLGATYVKQTDLNMTSQGYYYNPLPGLYLFPRGESFEDIQLYERYDAALGYYRRYWPYGNGNIGMDNPYWVQNRTLRSNGKKRYSLNASLKWQIADWIDVTGRVKVDNTSNRNTYKIYATSDLLFSSENGAYRNIFTMMNNTYADVIATVNKTFCEDWSLNVNFGAALDDTKAEGEGYNGNLSSIPNFFSVYNLDRTTKFKPTQTDYHYQSQAIFANIELGWKSMLYLTLTGRNDWDASLAYSKYSSFFYPSVGLSGVLTSMFEAPKWLGFLKVRTSYTEVGNSYGYFKNTVYYSYNGESSDWENSSIYPNLNLKPERTQSWEVGMNARLWNHLSVDLTYYRSHTKNQTFSAELPSSSGYSSIYVQSGDIQNQGVELALSYNNRWNDFTFGADYTLTWNENEVVRLADGATNPYTGEKISMPQLEAGSFGNLDAKVILRTGGSMGDVYGMSVLARDYNGYIDNSSGILPVEAKETFLGSIFPRANMGLNVHFGYRGIDLNTAFSARLGGIVLSGTESWLDYYGVSGRSAELRDNGGVAVKGGTISAQKYLQSVSGMATYYTYDATNVRLQELALNYSLPRKWFRNRVKMTVGFVARNLWMIYCRAPFDPELSANTASTFYQGYDCFMMPSTRNLGFNVKLQF